MVLFEVGLLIVAWVLWLVILLRLLIGASHRTHGSAMQAIVIRPDFPR